MNSKADIDPGALDTVKLLLAAAVLIGGVAAFYYFEDQSILLRTVGVLAALGVGVLIGLQSAQGQALWRFMQSSRVELRKVVWPTRQETLQTTLTVFVFVLVLGIFFWLLDMGLLWITRWLTGQGT
ncbi:MAG: preprotein translocase subunit SecE [Gammaproteobacteria bacterium]|nr:MAG: preprotein translocase subunit SecE [Gammaproteobacteria bacterium]